jgi:plastocyanin
MQPPRARIIAFSVSFLVLASVAAACSSDDSSGGDGTTTTTDAGTGDIVPGSAAISIVDLTFEPTTLSVASGSTEITITNADTVDHTFTLDDGSVDQEVAPGESATVSVDLTASTGFHCEIHPSMTGTLQVA